MRLGTRTVALVTILALYSGTSVQATPNLTGYPNSMAATGDSITRAYNTGTLPFSDRPDNSWSTGTRTSVGSHYRRILTAEPAILGRNYNQAVTGAKMIGLWTQMQQVNGEFYGNPKTSTFAKLLIDAEEDPYVRAVLVGMLRGAAPRFVSVAGRT